MIAVSSWSDTRAESGELDVAGDQPGDERVDMAGRVGAHHHPLTNLARDVTDTVADGHLRGELSNRHVDHGELSAPEFAAAFTGSSSPASAPSSEKQNIGEPEPAL
jgi:hypothetical protein